MLNKTLTILVFLSLPLLGQGKYFIPSFYYTYGSYTNSTNSNEYSSYLISGFGNYNFLVLGYDRIYLRNPLWNYKQDNFATGLSLSFNKLKTKLDFLYINGFYDDNFISKPLIDNGYLLSPEISYGVYPLYYGIGYALFIQKGNNKIASNQLYLRTDYYPHYKLLLSSLLSSHSISNRKELISLQVKVAYQLYWNLFLRLSFTVGARALFYNPDLMVLFNQLDTQTSFYSTQIEYTLRNFFTATLSYQKTKFSEYKVDYFVFGLKKIITY